ncbi:glycosyltransferase [Candidatus Woesearchaeota archaeon]|nr:glycosyltransferase [Candidatus Woesearchaeota archaeon]|tara:strand:- start:2420 stop:3331 length:912 start_codon:yes stop_codon:yes gene_type:complete
MDLSIVIPVYNEERNIAPLYQKLRDVLRHTGKKYELIFIDDGSTDNTFLELKNISQKDKQVKAIRFQRNFGKSAALSAGFDNVKGSIVITMDGDLQDDPGEIPKLLEKVKDSDLVVGWRYRRSDTLWKKLPSKLFNFLVTLFTGVRVHDSNCCFKAFKKKVVDNINLYGELHRYIPSIAYWKGFKVGEVKVMHNKRIHGKSKYGSSRLLKGFLDLITVKFLMQYSTRPMHLFGGVGLILSSLGSMVIVFLYLRKFLFGIRIGSVPYLFILGVLSVILGMQFVSLGLLGEMIIGKSRIKRYIIK